MIPTNRFQHGTTLVEVLIAAIIIGIGLLGIASLQVKALQASTEAEHRAKATDIAWALADRMRANLLSNTDLGDAYVSAAADTDFCVDNPAPPLSCAMIPGSTILAVDCDPAQMAVFDLYEARCASTGAKQALPGGSLAITCIDRVGGGDPCDPGSDMRITIAWSTRTNTLDTGTQTDRIIMAVSPGLDPGQ